MEEIELAVMPDLFGMDLAGIIVVGCEYECIRMPAETLSQNGLF